ncbi:MAG: hypothetical protein JNL07_10760 [Rhodospirillales bacterium]|nr:hypothetical protein [Rhodospirillales bacterium]
MSLGAVPGFLAALAVAPAAASAQTPRPPDTRIDVWMFGQRNDDATDSRLNKLTIRAQRTFELPAGWRAALRGDLPLLDTDKRGVGNPGGDFSAHLGDVLTQASVTTPQVLPGLTFSAGVRLVYPTGGKPPFGSAQWQVAPQVGMALTIPGIAEGLTIAPMARHFHGFSPTRAGVVTVRSWDLFPTVTLRLPDKWSVTFWDENPITYNERTNSWFVPFDVMVVKGIGESFQIAAGFATRIGGDAKSYKTIAYGRGTVLF